MTLSTEVNSNKHFYRATACNAMHCIALIILSARPSVCLSDARIVTKLNNKLWIF